MAGKEVTEPRKPATKRNAGTTININTSRPSGDRPPKDEAQQQPNPPTPTPEASPPEPPKPPLFTEPQRLQSYSPREARVASPLAATLLARFNPNDPREQPAEHAVFIDSRLRERGYI